MFLPSPTQHTRTATTMSAWVRPSLLPLRWRTRALPRRHRLLCTATHATPPPLNTPTHKPVLVNELLSHLPRSPTHIIDCTLGLGGHARQILSHKPSVTTYLGLDKDGHALRHARGVLPSPPVHFMQSDFGELARVLERDFPGFEADVVLLDVGVSSMQLDDAERGFSFMKDGPLDMRMSSCGVTAAELVNGLDEAELSRVIYEFGEEGHARRIARAVVRERERGWIGSTGGLAGLVVRVKGWGRGRKGAHPATKTFQALRIAVNGELEALERGVRQGVDALRVGGRIAVMSFHSLEDGIVKRAFRELERVDGGVRVVTKKPVVCTEGEIRENVRCRSAKLRVAERVARGEVGWTGKVNKYKNRNLKISSCG